MADAAPPEDPSTLSTAALKRALIAHGVAVVIEPIADLFLRDAWLRADRDALP